MFMDRDGLFFAPQKSGAVGEEDHQMSSVPEFGIEFVDRPDLQWAFVDTSSTSVENKAICKLEFCTLRWAPSGPELRASAKQYPVVRLAMSVNTMIELHKKLTRMLQQLEAEGVVNRAEPATKAHVIN
jgi:hypothetical protein